MQRLKNTCVRHRTSERAIVVRFIGERDTGPVKERLWLGSLLSETQDQ